MCENDWLTLFTKRAGVYNFLAFFTPKCGTKENKVNSHPLGLGKKEHRNERSLSALSYIPKHSYTVSLSDVLSHPISTMNRAKKKGKQSPCLLFLVPRAEVRRNKFHYTHIDAMTAIIFSFQREKIDVSWFIPSLPELSSVPRERCRPIITPSLNEKRPGG